VKFQVITVWRGERPRSSSRRRSDGEKAPFAGYALECVSAAVVELERSPKKFL